MGLLFLVRPYHGQLIRLDGAAVEREAVCHDVLVAQQDSAVRLGARRERHLGQLGPRDPFGAPLVPDDPALHHLRRVDAVLMEKVVQVPRELAVGILARELRVEILTFDDRGELVVEIDADAAAKSLFTMNVSFFTVLARRLAEGKQDSTAAGEREWEKGPCQDGRGNLDR